jgi:Sulfotransferase domain
MPVTTPASYRKVYPGRRVFFRSAGIRGRGAVAEAPAEGYVSAPARRRRTPASAGLDPAVHGPSGSRGAKLLSRNDAFMTADPFRIDFVAVGPQRTGTTWLDNLLRDHPDVSLPRHVKETMFFEQHFEKGVPWYASHFPKRAEGQVRGEVAPTCFDDPASPERIASLNPNCRIVVTLREPVGRTVSLWHHHVAKGRAPRDFREAVAAMPRIVESSRYARHLPRWIERFGRDRVLVLLIDDIRARPQQVLDTFTGFVGVAPRPAEGADEPFGAATMPRYPRLAAAAARTATSLRSLRLYWVAELGKRLGLKRVFTGGENAMPGLAPGDAEWLAQELAPDVEYVERLLGRELPAWRARVQGGAARNA